MNPIDAITPRCRKLSLSCGDFAMSEMSVRRAVELMRLLAGMSGEVKAALASGADNITAIAAFSAAALPHMDEIARLLIDGREETRLLCAQMTARDASELAAAAAEINDFPLIAANFRRAARILTTRSAPPSR
ncbi:MAG: hypothetical protein WC421_03510 [Elusimicrobiales bacterium]